MSTGTVNPSGDWTVFPELVFWAGAGVPLPVYTGALTMQGRPDAAAMAYTDGAVVRVVGTVKKRVSATSQQPLARLVRLHCQSTGRMVAQTWSSAAGDYVFDRVPAGRYMVLSVDHTGEFAGVLEPDVLVRVKPGEHEHRLLRYEPLTRAVPVTVFVRDRSSSSGGGGF